FVFFFSSRRRHTRLQGDWSSDVCSSDLKGRPIRSDRATDSLSHLLSRNRDCARAPIVARQRIPLIEKDRDRPTRLAASRAPRVGQSSLPRKAFRGDASAGSPIHQTSFPPRHRAWGVERRWFANLFCAEKEVCHQKAKDRVGVHVL